MTNPLVPQGSLKPSLDLTFACNGSRHDFTCITYSQLQQADRCDGLGTSAGRQRDPVISLLPNCSSHWISSALTSEMSHSSPSAEVADAFTRPGPSHGALFEANQQLQARAASPTAFDRRFDEPPPSYHSKSRSRPLR